jgi:hypothetical protein
MAYTTNLYVIDDGVTQHRDGPPLWEVTNGSNSTRVWFEESTQQFHWSGQKMQGARRLIERVSRSFERCNR